MTTNDDRKQESSTPLIALTRAAFILPGLIQLDPLLAAEDDSVNFQYSHYQEGNRNLYGTVSQFNPIEVESFLGNSKLTLTDRIKFAFNYTQDTWSGATPISTLPRAFNANNDILEPKNADVKIGASPYLQPNGLLLDKNLHPIEKTFDPNGMGDFNGFFLRRNDQLVHTLSFASPEVRKQGDFNLTYE